MTIEATSSTTKEKSKKEVEKKNTMRKEVAVVTGAATGIGRAATIQLCQKGYKVYACGRNTNNLNKLLDIHPEYDIVPYELDITDMESIIKFQKYLDDNLVDGKLDILYNNAGQSCTFPALDVTAAQVEQCFAVNVFGHINMTRELSRFIIKGQGTIIFTGSCAGIMPFPFGSIYSASKAAIHAYARVLHLEMKPIGVRVINVVTGGVDTSIADTRPLPETSIYNSLEGQKAFQYRQLMSQNNKPMSPETYVKSVLEVVYNREKDPLDIYRGTKAILMKFAYKFVPTCVLEWYLTRKFHLGPLVESFQKRKTA